MTTPLPGPRTWARPLDAVDAFEVSGSGTALAVHARKTVRATDPYMAGHFPGLTLLPAVFLLEGVRQCVGSAVTGSPVLAAHLGTDVRDDWLEVHAVRSLRVVKPMLEGDELHLDIDVTAPAPGVLRAMAQCRREGGPLVATLTVELVRGGGHP